jgi:hypothetical protein
MKSRLLFVMCIAQSLFCFGQSNFSFGFKGGVGYSGWQDTYKSNYLQPGHTIAHQFTSARMIGLVSGYRLPFRLRLNAEAAYIESGSEHLDRWTGVIHEPTGLPFTKVEKVTYKVSRVSAPISISYDIFKTRITPYARAGISPPFIQNGTRTFQYYLSTTGEDFKNKEDLRLDGVRNRHLKFSIPAVGAIGIRLFERLSMEASIVIGSKFYYDRLPDNFVCPDECITPELSYNNRVIMFAAAYSILP